ncbi:hypothetical protein [Candidatus Laterigemmans baculatus]|uniref:hypothetical protein n=1 Tax=Candidatus Laterigemmans baculatus TaxID=2770505 RepID=UPI0013DC63C8|nr:hypothetical protein [Candidatus Laterigemmans baculatus]
MIPFRTRRRLALAITAVAVVLLVLGNGWIRERLGHASYYSGGTLLGCLVLLILLGLRKRLVMLPLGSVSTWVQIHLYTGLFALAAYALHVPRILANGIFEGGLSLLFLGVSLSGLYGWFVSRSAPRKLTAVAGDYRLERVGWDRQRIADAAAKLCKRLDASLASNVLADYYSNALQPYFATRPPLAYLAVPNGIRRRRLLSNLNNLDRYLSDETRGLAGQLAALVRTRDELDFHFALQLRLRLWVVVHSMLSVALLVWSCAHVLLVLNFI